MVPTLWSEEYIRTWSRPLLPIMGPDAHRVHIPRMGSLQRQTKCMMMNHDNLGYQCSFAIRVISSFIYPLNAKENASLGRDACWQRIISAEIYL